MVRRVIVMAKRRPIDFYVDENGCYICTSHVKDPRGYIKICVNGRLQYIHRYIFEQCFRPLESWEQVDHTCDRVDCINPDHLKIYDYKKNFTKLPLGEDHCFSKLTTQQVIEIKKDKSSKHVELARKYNVSPNVISDIRKGLAWKHVNI
jgi:hypothetical protein